MNNPNKKRLRRTMMFLNAQKPGLIKDPYIYKADSLMLDLEDAVAENQKDVARFSLYHALKTVDYRGAERVVRINGLDTPYWREDIRACVAGGCDSIRIPKTEHAEDVHRVACLLYTSEPERCNVRDGDCPTGHGRFSADGVRRPSAERKGGSRRRLKARLP